MQALKLTQLLISSIYDGTSLFNKPSHLWFIIIQQSMGVYE